MDKFGNVHASNPDAANPKPVIIVAHGAWHVPAHYEPMAKPLREAGYQVIIPQHQSVGPSKDAGDALQNDAAALARLIQSNAQLGRDVVLLMHSYGGVAGSEAVALLKGGGRIKRLIFLAAHAFEKGTSLLNKRKIADIQYSETGMMTHMHPYERYYHEISSEDAKAPVSLLQPMARSAFESPTRFEGWKDYKIPTTYIRCSLDTAVPPELCDTYVERMQQAGVPVELETIEAGHCAHWTAPSLVVGIVEKVASSVNNE